MDVRSCVIKCDGSRSLIAPANGHDFTLEELRDIIRHDLSGDEIMIETVTLPDFIIICDEDGRMKGLPTNHFASMVFGHLVVGGDFVGNIAVIQRGQLQ